MHHCRSTHRHRTRSHDTTASCHPRHVWHTHSPCALQVRRSLEPALAGATLPSLAPIRTGRHLTAHAGHSITPGACPAAPSLCNSTDGYGSDRSEWDSPYASVDASAAVSRHGPSRLGQREHTLASRSLEHHYTHDGNGGPPPVTISPAHAGHIQPHAHAATTTHLRHPPAQAADPTHPPTQPPPHNQDQQLAGAAHSHRRTDSSENCGCGQDACPARSSHATALHPQHHHQQHQQHQQQQHQHHTHQPSTHHPQQQQQQQHTAPEQHQQYTNHPLLMQHHPLHQPQPQHQPQQLQQHQQQQHISSSSSRRLPPDMLAQNQNHRSVSTTGSLDGDAVAQYLSSPRVSQRRADVSAHRGSYNSLSQLMGPEPGSEPRRNLFASAGHLLTSATSPEYAVQGELGHLGGGCGGGGGFAGGEFGTGEGEPGWGSGGGGRQKLKGQSALLLMAGALCCHAASQGLRAAAVVVSVYGDSFHLAVPIALMGLPLGLACTGITRGLNLPSANAATLAACAVSLLLLLSMAAPLLATPLGSATLDTIQPTYDAEWHVTGKAMAASAGALLAVSAHCVWPAASWAKPRRAGSGVVLGLVVAIACSLLQACFCVSTPYCLRLPAVAAAGVVA
ncbi:MAG: hypothetical protein WDW36_000508 [Sanguina aurantia]